MVSNSTVGLALALENGTMNTMPNAIDGSGRIVIPKRLRDELGLLPGVPLTFSTDGVALRIEPTRRGGRLVRRGGRLVVVSESERSVSDEEIRDAIDASRR